MLVVPPPEVYAVSPMNVVVLVLDIETEVSFVLKLDESIRKNLNPFCNVMSAHRSNA